MWSYFFSLNSLNTIQDDPKTCLSGWTILILLSIEGSKQGTFIGGATLHICEIVKYEPAKSVRWVYWTKYKNVKAVAVNISTECQENCFQEYYKITQHMDQDT
jgi:hypothetical protein